MRVCVREGREGRVSTPTYTPQVVADTGGGGERARERSSPIIVKEGWKTCSWDRVFLTYGVLMGVTPLGERFCRQSDKEYNASRRKLFVVYLTHIFATLTLVSKSEW